MVQDFASSLGYSCLAAAQGRETFDTGERDYLVGLLSFRVLLDQGGERQKIFESILHLRDLQSCISLGSCLGRLDLGLLERLGLFNLRTKGRCFKHAEGETNL